MKFKLLTIYLVLSSNILLGQACSGGLGDPIVNITFGSGTAEYGPPLAPGVTNLTYQQDTCPQQGADQNSPGGYAIVHSPGLNCFGGDWVNFTGDHTGDPNGYFMLVNASFAPNTFYVQQVNGLCPSTSYQFSAWIVNMASMYGEINPDITFSITQTDGTVIQSFDTGPVPIVNPAQWNQYAFYFTTPPGTSSVIISMFNNAPGGYGNDLGLDDITFRTSGPSIGIDIPGHSGDTVTLCSAPDNAVAFTSTIGSCYSSTAYQWQESIDSGKSWSNIPNAIDPAYSAAPAAPGKYLYRLTAAQTGNIGLSACQVVSAADSILVLQTTNPAVSISLRSGYACVDSPAAFVASPMGGGSQPGYQWMVNGSPVSSGGPTFDSTLANGDQVSCQMTSDTVCANPPTVPSNAITLHLLPDVVSSVSITSSANNICRDSVVAFTASPSNGGSQPSFQWLINGQPVGTDTAVYLTGSLQQGDVVTLVMTSGLTCSRPDTSNAIAMTVYDVPAVSLPPDTVIAPGTAFVMDPVIVGLVDRYQWEPATGLSDPLAENPVASPAVTTVYSLVVSNDHCSASAAEKVEVFYDLQMPNAFTPDGDGKNDLYRVPPGITVTIKRLSIFNRWGGQVFSTDDSMQGWDGTINGRPQPAGTYVWIVEYFNPLLKKMMMKKGTVELIR